MNDQNESRLSAQVILKPKGGSGEISAEEITAANVSRLMPAAEDFQAARKYFADLGFEVDDGFANSFSITGDRKLFEKTFAAEISRNEKSAVKVRRADTADASELPLEKLSAAARKIVETVTFTEPPDFGPGNF